MTFKQNLLKKIEIDQMSRHILNTIGPFESGLKLDKETMRRLLEFGRYDYQHQRDLDLYIDATDPAANWILVLDNEIPIYRSTIKDVVMRKSPTLKEMLSIRNAVKILSTSDILVSKKEDSVKIVRRKCIDLLDLSFDRSDISQIENEGIQSLERDYADGVLESLLLFSELLGYGPVPKKLELPHHVIFGMLDTGEAGLLRLGPVVMYNKIEGTLKLNQDRFEGTEKEIEYVLEEVSSGHKEASFEGPDVFKHLSGSVEIQPLNLADSF
ncbi:MAG: hypothetical protein R6U50_11805 [Desulfobacterales bacterium]